MRKAESVDPEPEDPAKSAKTELSREKKGVILRVRFGKWILFHKV